MNHVLYYLRVICLGIGFSQIDANSTAIISFSIPCIAVLHHAIIGD